MNETEDDYRKYLKKMASSHKEPLRFDARIENSGALANHQAMHFNGYKDIASSDEENNYTVDLTANPVMRHRRRFG